MASLQSIEFSKFGAEGAVTYNAIIKADPERGVDHDA